MFNAGAEYHLMKSLFKYYGISIPALLIGSGIMYLLTLYQIQNDHEMCVESVQHLEADITLQEKTVMKRYFRAALESNEME